MNDEKKTKIQLIQELKHLRREFSQLKTSTNTREELVVSALPMVFYTAKPEGTFDRTWLSQQIEKLTGVSPRQFAEIPGFWSSKLHPDDRDRVLKEFENALTQGSVTTEYRWLGAEGYLWILDHAVLVLNAHGKPSRVFGVWLDITERKEAEERLRNQFEAEKLLSEISTEFMNVNSEVLEAHIHTGLRKVGEFAKVDHASLFLFSKEQKLVSEVFEWVKPENRPLNEIFVGQPVTMFPWIMDQLIRNKPVEVSTIHQLPEGATHERELFVTLGVKSFLIVPIHVDNQLFGAVGLVAYDHPRFWFRYQLRILQFVAEVFSSTIARKEAEEKLLASSGRLNAIFQASPLAITAIDRDGKVIVWNPAAERMFEWQEEEVLNQPLPVVPPDKQKESINLQKMAFQGESLVGLDLVRQKKNGSLMDVRLSTAALRDSKGLIVGALGIFDDVSEAKRKEKEIKRLSDQLSLIMDSLPVVCFLAKTEDDYSATYITPNTIPVFGFEPQAFTTKPSIWASRIHPEDAPRVFGGLSQLFATGHYRYEYRWQVADGSYRWFNEVLRLTNSSEETSYVVGIVWDITERKGAEGALRQSEERYRLLVENAVEGICVAQDGRVHFVNPKLEEISGYSQEELTSKSFTDFIHPEDREMVYSRHRARLNGESLPESYSFRVVHRSGEIRWVRIGVTTITWKDRSATLNFLTDITHERQTEEELQKYRYHLENLIEERTTKLEASKEALSRSDQRYREIIELAQEGVWMTDVSGKTSYVNHQMAVMLGYSAAEILSRLVSDFMAPESTPLWDQFFRRCAAGVKDRYDFRLRTREGKYFWVMVASAPRHDEEGRFNGALLMVTDISERKEAIEKIVTSKKMLQRVFDGISEPLIMMDKDFVVRMVNATAKEYYHLETYHQIIGKPLLQDFLESDEAGRQVRAAVNEGKVLTYERKNPSHPNRFERVITYSLRGNEGILGDAIIRISDITEARLLQREVIQNEKLASLGLLISSIAHEINNPANFISFNVPVLRDYLQEMLPILDDYATQHPDHELLGMDYPTFREDVSKLLGNIEHGIARINTVVSNLKEFSRKKDYEGWQRVPLSEVADKVVAICSGELKKRVKSVDINVSEDLPRVFADPGAVEQILVNLLINAIQATDKEDSWIRVCVRLDPSSTDYVQIEVSDNGCGMDKNILDRIFEPFFTTKPPGTGTGLGLYVSQNLIDELGGEITVESQPGMGTTFRIQIPVERAGEGPSINSLS